MRFGVDKLARAEACDAPTFGSVDYSKPECRWGRMKELPLDGGVTISN